jgi:hypothetical protein
VIPSMFCKSISTLSSVMFGHSKQCLEGKYFERTMLEWIKNELQMVALLRKGCHKKERKIPRTLTLMPYGN